MLYLWLSVYWTRGIEDREDDNISEQRQNNVIMPLIKLFLGVTMVIISSQILIPAAQETAKRFGVPSSIIAATLVAFGTSLPELVTSVIAIRKGQMDIGVGNIIGSNIYNILLIGGIAATIIGIPVSSDTFSHYYIMIAFSLVLFVGFRKYIPKPVGVGLVAAFVIYLGSLLV